jgi:hypothetical protein
MNSTPRQREVVNYLTSIAPATATAAEIYENCSELHYDTEPVKRTGAYLSKLIKLGIIARVSTNAYKAVGKFPGKQYKLPMGTGRGLWR